MHAYSLYAVLWLGPKLKCPGSSCAYQSRRWIVHSPVASRTGDTQIWQQMEQCIVLPLDFKRHPNLFFQHQPDQYQDVHSILSLVTKNKANPRASHYYAVELRNDSTNQELSNGGLFDLQEIGGWRFIPVLFHLTTILSS